ncbi:alpha/beta hydrolase [Curtobacterium sp. MCJR17_055]|uniref:alpha/beta hydrolase n=1 Tax=unclassified Curtobacterium TaxID=257496 RepID=UPI000D8072D1|nr:MULTISPECIES: alpha/beta hydrolase [unclassified Curtobacterium]PYY32306.1 alpha/beta hydrolase [Curtobacterium sp. MCBD17_029]PYY54637.1 alpha/beta hydrolase [Curtobacterium sp. MCJR17_055]PYY60872.1 alpha/beta hydrolase [Curtobacterium sp. MCPF17_015]
MTDAGWHEDVLGPPYERLELPLGEDAEGPVVATLVRRRRTMTDRLRPRAGPLHDVDVLYVHGWSDYFFQTELAERVERLGARFHALDLRKYGRSLRPHQTPGHVGDLATYDEDIAAALDAIRAEHPGQRRRLVPMGHSTGGLTLALWAARHPALVEGLVLNSPWLEFQADAIGRAVVAPVIKLGAKRNPLAPMPAVDPGFYTRTVSSSAEGSWTYDQRWRPERGFPLHPGWLAAVFAGQERVAHGLGLTVPVLVMLSDKSMLQPRWNEGMSHADVALNVDAVARRALSLGDEVTVRRLHGALHDVVLSAAPVRERAYDAVERWSAVLPR